MAKSNDRPEVIIATQAQRQKSFRYVIVCALIFGCVWLISGSIVKIFEQPAWLTATIAIVEIIPNLLFIWLYLKYRKHSKDCANKLARLQRKLDPSRTSSDLNLDGTSEIDQ